MSDSRISQHDELTILLAEYTSLRDELLQRNTVLNQTYAMAAAIVAGIFTLLASPLWVVGVILTIVLPLPVALFTLMLRYDTDDAAARVREIEAMVNEIAGKQLLVWETRHGLSSVSYWDRLRIVLRGRSN